MSPAQRVTRGARWLGICRLALLALIVLLALRPLIALSEEPDPPAKVEYARVRASPAPISQTPAQAETKSAGCKSCHTASDAATMHPNAAVVLGSTDCHRGDASVSAASALDLKGVAYAALRDLAHVLPLYPKDWNFPHPAKPRRSYTLLNRESPEFVRFINPSDYRVAREACGACHLELIHAAERSLMATGAMFWGRASYNNGVLPFKSYRFGEAYTRTGEAAALLSP